MEEELRRDSHLKRPEAIDVSMRCTEKRTLLAAKNKHTKQIDIVTFGVVIVK